MILHTLIFLISCGLMFLSGKFLMESLIRIAHFLQWKEFVVAFFVMAIAGSIPNLFVGISSAFHGISQLSFGEIVGGNLFDMTAVVALATLFSKGLSANSKMVQTSSFFMIAIAILPLLLILDGQLGRGDGLVLLLVFIFYIWWLFSKKERFSKSYIEQVEVVKGFKVFIKDIARAFLGLTFLLVAAEGIVRSALYFAGTFNLEVALIGILIIGIGNALPETYFAIVSARSGKNWMVLGDILGSIIVPSTLVLGIVSLISPIEITHFSLFAIARFFLVIASVFFIFFVKTDRRISKKEAWFLLTIYISFVIVEILIH